MQNEYLVGSVNDEVTIMNPPRPGERLTREQALHLAAYLVALADPGGKKFADVLDKVLNG
jgi:hypothetical protein